MSAGHSRFFTLRQPLRLTVPESLYRRYRNSAYEKSRAASLQRSPAGSDLLFRDAELRPGRSGSPFGLTFDSAGNLYVADTTEPFAYDSVHKGVLSAQCWMPRARPPRRLPGKILVIYGSGMGPATLAVNKPVNGIYSTTFAGTTVLIEGSQAPILYTSANQIPCRALRNYRSSPVILPGRQPGNCLNNGSHRLLLLRESRQSRPASSR